MQFIDKAKIRVEAGKGGDGTVAFRREAHVPKGGPAGGDGGRGGSVIFQATTSLSTLLDLKYNRLYKAPSGQNGMAKKMHGKDAIDTVIKVPVGTMILNEETGQIMADLTEDKQRVVIAKGGRGGRGNARFATSRNPAPQICERGEPGENFDLICELKLLADVGLVGFPSVGKSTLLSVVSRARPEIADYHFTTLSPNLGVLQVDGRSYTMADIPGLIEGASSGQGLGHEFLRHIERTRVLIHVIDASALEGRDVLEDYHTIMQELSEYNEELAKRPMVVAANKADLPMAEENIQRLKTALEPKGIKVFAVSAAAHKGLKEMLRCVADLVDALPPIVLEPETFDESMLWKQKTFTVEKLSEDYYEVQGDLAEEIIRRMYPNDRDSIRYFGEQLEKQGIVAALREKGARDGDTVLMAGYEFEFVE
ncbi:MAG: GTPase ObgE [Clostridiales bacterium]|nr:GTPase ObgE [Clostridiales bacterium]